jgi:Uma2 family endonuclease
MTTPVLHPTKPTIPPLRNGDHLDRVEFERRYEAMPNGTRAELIEGVVYMTAAVRAQEHGTPHSAVMYWLTNYWARTTGTRVCDNTSLRLDLDNAPQPDALLMIDVGHGGHATIDEDGYISGGPELVVEVAASTVSMDRNTKLRLYRRNGVQEYVLWRVEQEALDWFVLRGGQYEQLDAGADGIHRSEVFPGLWLDAPALLCLDLLRVFDVLQQGLATPEHAAFVAQLNPPATP